MTTQLNPTKRIFVCEPFLDGRELEYVMDAVKTTWISSSGRYLKDFEAGFSSYTGNRHGIAVSNGTAALHLLLAAAGIGPGDEVILPNFSMIAPAFAIVYCGAQPVFVDVDAQTWTMNPALLESKITPKTKAILTVNIYGHPTDMDPILTVAKKHGLKVFEDAAEGHGAEYKSRRAGSMGDAATFSFYANKNITTGEGGMVVTNDDKLAERCRYLKNLCFPLTGGRTYIHEDVGFNYRMTNVQAAIGLAQFEKIDFYVQKRREHAFAYNRRLQKLPQLQLPTEKEWAKNCFWMYGVVLNENVRIGRDALMAVLSNDGVETRSFFYPLHKQPSLLKNGASGVGDYPVTDHLSTNGFYLPSGSGLTEEQIDYVCDRLIAHLK